MPRSTLVRKEIVGHVCGVFRSHGYEGTTMAVLSQATGLQKSSLYHHFPGGKNEMLETAVLATIVELERRVFRFLDTNDDAAGRIAQVLEGFEIYTNGGRRSCLLAVIAQSSVAENFKSRIGAQFSAWITRLSTTLVEFGHGQKSADTLALETLETLYGSLVVGRLLGTFDIFDLGLERCRTNIGLDDKIEFS
jgi:AcrR family transcriptional regulator